MKITNKFVTIALCTATIGTMSLPISVNAETADSAQVISVNATAPSKEKEGGSSQLLSCNGKVIDCASLLTEQAETLRKLFDAEYYAETYPDVTAALGITDTKNLTEEQKTKLFQHYMEYGINEGRKITDKISSSKVSEDVDIQSTDASSSDTDAQTAQSSSADDLPVGDLNQPIIVNADNLNPYEGIWTPAGEGTVTIEEPWVSQPDKYPPVMYCPEGQ